MVDAATLADLGIVVIAHGSRRIEANQDLFAIVERFRDRGLGKVFPAFLELAQPDIVSAGRQCIAAGAKRVVLLPYFLSAGNHVVQDLESARRELMAEFPRIQVSRADPLGPHPLLDEILLDRLADSLQDGRDENCRVSLPSGNLAENPNNA